MTKKTGHAGGNSPRASAAKPGKSVRLGQTASSGRWLLADAKARFSELVRLAKSQGPQHVTVHGRAEVVVLSADAFRKLTGEQTGQALIDVMQATPLDDLIIERPVERSPVRRVRL